VDRRHPPGPRHGDHGRTHHRHGNEHQQASDQVGRARAKPDAHDAADQQRDDGRGGEQPVQRRHNLSALRVLYAQ
jgi:hypothetical protein